MTALTNSIRNLYKLDKHKNTVCYFANCSLGRTDAFSLYKQVFEKICRQNQLKNGGQLLR